MFQQELVDYLESVHQGEFLTGTMDSVQASIPLQTEVRGGIHAVTHQANDVSVNAASSEYRDPTQTMPVPAPPRCMDCRLAAAKNVRIITNGGITTDEL